MNDNPTNDNKMNPNETKSKIQPPTEPNAESSANGAKAQQADAKMTPEPPTMAAPAASEPAAVSIAPLPPSVPAPPAPPVYPAALSDEQVETRMRAISRRGFLWGAVALATTYTGWHWLNTRRAEADLVWPFRRALEINEQLSRDYFSGARLAPTFDRSQAREIRVNPASDAPGLPDDDGFDPADWKLHLKGAAEMGATSTNEEHNNEATSQPAKQDQASSGKSGASSSAATESRDSSGDSSDSASSDNGDTATPAGMTFTLADIKKLPRIEMTTEFKCIEGWSTIVTWAGARFADFIAKHPPATKSGNPPDVAHHPEDLMDYVSLRTPDEGYYVGLDMASALHPQTLLCYEMNGQPLALEHGAPLRLVIPTKYGIKNIKRIGTIEYTDKRPADYWAEQGYDWYAGH